MQNDSESHCRLLDVKNQMQRGSSNNQSPINTMNSLEIIYPRGLLVTFSNIIIYVFIYLLIFLYNAMKTD